MARPKTNETICITLYKKIKTNAEKRKLDFDVSLEYLWDLYLIQDKKCILTGVDINIVNATIRLNYHLNTASLDRIDNDKGYVEGNVRWVHKLINQLKSDFKDNELIHLCSLISKYNPINIPFDIDSLVSRRTTNTSIDRMRQSNTSKIKIIQYNMDKIEVRRWNSINDAVRELNYKSPMGIISSCKGRQKSSGGYIWEYE